MAYHFLSHEDLNVRLAVVYTEGEPNHLWADLRTARPRLDNRASLRFLSSYLLEELLIDVWAFIE